MEGTVHNPRIWERDFGADLLQEFRPKLAEYCVDAVQFISDAQRSNKKILIEGANALMASLPQLLPLDDRGRNWRLAIVFPTTTPS